MLCTQFGEKPAVALAWLLHNQAATAPIVGPRTVEQPTLTDEAMKRRDEIWPGPGGEAPMAQARQA